MRLNPLIFTGSKVEEDTQGLIYEMEKFFLVMHAYDSKGVEFIEFQLKNVVY